MGDGVLKLNGTLKAIYQIAVLVSLIVALTIAVGNKADKAAVAAVQNKTVQLEEQNKTLKEQLTDLKKSLEIIQERQIVILQELSKLNRKESDK